MSTPNSLLSAKPGSRLRRSGETREPVGGFVGQARPISPAAAGRPRGFTVPVTATNVSTEIQPADFQRKFLYIVNNDAVGIAYLSFGGDRAVVGQGIRLAPGGGGVLLDNNVPTERMFIIGSIANNPNLTMVVA